MRSRDHTATAPCLLMRVAISVLLHDASVGISLELLVAEQQLLELICSHPSATIICYSIMVAILVVRVLMLLPLGTAMTAGHQARRCAWVHSDVLELLLVQALEHIIVLGCSNGVER